MWGSAVTDISRSQRFADALRALEEGDEQPILAQFVQGAELKRPQRKDSQGDSDNAQSFWDEYMGQFERIATEFDRVVDSGDEGILEWHSSGTLVTGRSIEYAGVSLLRFTDGGVERFATYYDTAAFIAPSG